MNNLTIYFNEKQVCFLNKDQSLPDYDKKLTVLSNSEDLNSLKQDFDWFLKQDNCSTLVFISEKQTKVKKLFFSLFKIIEAAGGFIHNADGALFMYRNNKWDLPKGKIDKGETPKKAAVRECEEECGVSKLKIIKVLPATYHIYTLKGDLILKKTHWYEMTMPTKQMLVPQIEEGITELKMYKKKEIAKPMKNTFPSVIDVLINMGW